MATYKNNLVIGALFFSLLGAGAGCEGDAQIEESAALEYDTVRQSELLYVMNAQEADERFALGSADFIPLASFEQISLTFTAADITQLQYQLRNAEGQWGEWMPAPMEWSEGEFHTSFVDLGEGKSATALRLKGVEGLEFARVEFLGKSELVEARPDIVSELRRPGLWQPPESTIRAGQQHAWNYSSAGSRCSSGATPGALGLSGYIKENFGGVSSIGIYNCRKIGGSSNLSLHGVGRALDIMIPVDGSWNDRASANNDVGDPIANWLIENSEAIGIQYIVWDRNSWGSHRNGSKLRAYNGQHAHHDHIHVELTPEGAQKRTPFFNGGQTTAPGSSPSGGGGMSAGNTSGNSDGAPTVAVSKRYDTLEGDFNGDGKSDIVTISKDGGGGWADWFALDLASESGFKSLVWNATTNVHMRNGDATKDYTPLVGDFNGDGKDDVATISKNGGGGWADWFAVELSTGASFDSKAWTSSTPRHMRNGSSQRDYKSLVGDFNGDGKDDVVTISKNGEGGWVEWVSMDISNGKGFDNTVWATLTPALMRLGGSNNNYETLVGDFNADGKDDLATISRNGNGGWAEWISVDLSTGTGFQNNMWKAAAPAHMRNGGSNNDYRFLVGDFDGNGTDDIATLSRNGGGSWSQWVSVELSTGFNFFSNSWNAATPIHMRNGGEGNDYRHRVGDINGDGKADIMTLSTNGGGGWAEWVATEISTGKGFASSSMSVEAPGHIRNGDAKHDFRVFFADFTGDGRDDLAVLSPNALGGWKHWYAMGISTGDGLKSTVWGSATPTHMRNGL